MARKSETPHEAEGCPVHDATAAPGDEADADQAAPVAGGERALQASAPGRRAAHGPPRPATPDER
jgi:hypothetical protein